MTHDHLQQILTQHAAWLADPTTGARANLTDADLTGADLTDANLYDANLTGADLTGADLTDANLYDANLTRANLTRANLTRANLYDANLTSANLTSANLTSADLYDANLYDANIDYSAWPLQCTSLKAIVDNRLAAQLLFHAFAVAAINPTPEQIDFIRAFHRFDECGGAERLNTRPERPARKEDTPC